MKKTKQKDNTLLTVVLTAVLSIVATWAVMMGMDMNNASYGDVSFSLPPGYAVEGTDLIKNGQRMMGEGGSSLGLPTAELIANDRFDSLNAFGAYEFTTGDSDFNLEQPPATLTVSKTMMGETEFTVIENAEPPGGTYYLAYVDGWVLGLHAINASDSDVMTILKSLRLNQ